MKNRAISNENFTFPQQGGIAAGEWFHMKTERLCAAIEARSPSRKSENEMARLAISISDPGLSFVSLVDEGHGFYAGRNFI